MSKNISHTIPDGTHLNKVPKMTVKELITELSKLEQSQHISVYTGSYVISRDDYTEIKTVEESAVADGYTIILV